MKLRFGFRDSESGRYVDITVRVKGKCLKSIGPIPRVTADAIIRDLDTGREESINDIDSINLYEAAQANKIVDSTVEYGIVESFVPVFDVTYRIKNAHIETYRNYEDKAIIRVK